MRLCQVSSHSKPVRFLLQALAALLSDFDEQKLSLIQCLPHNLTMGKVSRVTLAFHYLIVYVI